MNKQSSLQPFAEVVESKLTYLIAQCWQWDVTPTFGSLVSIAGKESTLIGIVSSIETGSMDPMRYPFPYQKTEEELKRDHPQIFDFLKTTFTATIIGYQDKEHKVAYTIPPLPAKIHSFVSPISSDTAASFFQSPDFLPLLFAAQETPHITDELFLSLIGEMAQRNVLSVQLFKTYYKTFSLLTGNDYRRLKLLMQRVTTKHAKLLVGL